MKYLRTPRFWLLTTAALIFGSHMSATAQSSNVYQPGTYNIGAPTMVAAAPSLPNIPADQIARDVTAEFNPRSGRTELIAAPFDPFEEDPFLAGSLRLRSAEGAVSIDGHPLHNGALVEVDFYYNSPSDDPYSGRQYGEAGFVTGELAPVVLRDTRILECSTRVDEVVYEHNVYYSPTSSRYGIYQPYRHYAGHSGFGFGFGSNYFGPGYSLYTNNRSRRFGGRNTAFLPRVNTPNAGNRFRGAAARDRRAALIGRALGENTVPSQPQAAVPSISSSNLTATEIQQRRDAFRERRSDLRNGGRRGSRRFITAPPRVDVDPAPDRTEADASTTAQTNRDAGSDRRRAVVGRFLSGRRGSARDRNVVSGQVNPKRNAFAPSLPKQNGVRVVPKQSVTTPVIAKRTSPQLSAPKINTPKVSAPKTSTPKKNTSKSSSSSRKSKSSSRSQRTKSSSRSSSSRRTPTRSRQPSRRSTSRPTRRKLNFFPNDGYSGASFGTSRSVDCAREDKLSVFIPNERLDAASFDGLTLIALDAQGGETPIYIPPNYIQGYRLAATGRVQPQGFSATPQRQLQTPQFQQPQFQQPELQRPAIEAAPCPAGTLKQPNGTCLQTSGASYPTR